MHTLLNNYLDLEVRRIIGFRAIILHMFGI